MSHESAPATYKAGMTLSAPTTAAAIAERIQHIAQAALAETGGDPCHGIEDDIAAERAALIAAGQKPPEPERGSSTGLISLSLNIALERRRENPVVLAKQEILFLLLLPQLNLVMQAARRNRAVTDYMQDRIGFRTAEVLEQKILQDPPTGLDLRMLAGATHKRTRGGALMFEKDGVTPVMRPATDAVGWARMTLFGTIGATTKRVFQNEGGHILDPLNDHTNTDDGTLTTGVYRSVIDLSVMRSAEDVALEEEPFDDTPLEEQLARFIATTQGARGASRLLASARVLHEQFEIPELLIPESPTERHAILRAVKADPLAARRSLHIAATAEWEKAVTDTDKLLLSLWDDFTAGTAERVLGMRDGAQVPALLAEASVTLPSRPSRETLREARAILRDAATETTGWTTLANNLFNSYIAGNYALSSDYDTRGVHGSAVDEQLAQAAAWGTHAAAVLAFPQKPLGTKVRTENDVAAWLGKLIAGCSK